ncbi:hypothetical protein Dsin_028003 [Dipteronia sinensis]|uniref:Uncharacterized protein n=1 Tax=Dipteronia sinensis TaxID=43782 RepID=A0AAE0DV49_9ROSI|nr:hypothetical protein Dsin_028003 [Dipteronia sinensis]
MEDHLIEKNNGLNGQIDRDETEDQGSVGTIVSYPEDDGHLGLRRRRTNVSYSEDDHQHQETHIQNDDHNRHLQRPSPKFDLIGKILNYVSFGWPTVDQFYLTLKKLEPRLFNKPRDDHFGLLWRGTNLSSRGGWMNWSSDTDEGEWVDCSHSLHNDYYLWNPRDLGEGVDEVSQMIYRPTFIAAAGTDCNHSLGTTWHTEISLCNDEEVHGKRKGWSQKMDFEWIFVITNIVLESMSAIFTQLSSKQKPQYALYGMLLSYLALLTCIIELIYEGFRHQQIPNWRRRAKSFATLNNIVALACALGQCVVTTINYSYESPIKLTVSPIILANGVLFSKILKYRKRSTLI